MVNSTLTSTQQARQTLKFFNPRWFGLRKTEQLSPATTALPGLVVLGTPSPVLPNIDATS